MINKLKGEIKNDELDDLSVSKHELRVSYVLIVNTQNYEVVYRRVEVCISGLSSIQYLNYTTLIFLLLHEVFHN